MLGYVLPDRENSLALDTIAIYSDWQPALLTYPVGELLSNASRGATPTLAELNAEFRARVH